MRAFNARKQFAQAAGNLSVDHASSRWRAKPSPGSPTSNAECRTHHTTHSPPVFNGRPNKPAR
eukprot:11168007-Lingulodinium_polyedra.AAC.1